MEKKKQKAMKRISFVMLLLYFTSIKCCSTWIITVLLLLKNLTLSLIRKVYLKETNLSWLLCNFVEIAFRHGFSPVSLLLIFRRPFRRNTSGWLLLELVCGNIVSRDAIWIHRTQNTFIRRNCFLLGATYLCRMQYQFRACNMDS